MFLLDLVLTKTSIVITPFVFEFSRTKHYFLFYLSADVNYVVCCYTF